MNSGVYGSLIGHHPIDQFGKDGEAHDEEDRFDKGGALLDGYPRAQDGADDAGEGGEDPVEIVDFAGGGKQDQGSDVADKIEQFAVAGGIDKIHAEKLDEDEQEERAGARTEEAVIEAQEEAEAHAGGDLPAGGYFKGVNQSQIFFEVGINPHHQDHHGNQGIKEILA